MQAADFERALAGEVGAERAHALAKVLRGNVLSFGAFVIQASLRQESEECYSRGSRRRSDYPYASIDFCTQYGSGHHDVLEAFVTALDSFEMWSPPFFGCGDASTETSAADLGGPTQLPVSGDDDTRRDVSGFFYADPVVLTSARRMFLFVPPSNSDAVPIRLFWLSSLPVDVLTRCSINVNRISFDGNNLHVPPESEICISCRCVAVHFVGNETFGAIVYIFACLLSFLRTNRYYTTANTYGRVLSALDNLLSLTEAEDEAGSLAEKTAKKWNAKFPSSGIVVVRQRCENGATKLKWETETTSPRWPPASPTASSGGWEEDALLAAPVLSLEALDCLALEIHASGSVSPRAEELASAGAVIEAAAEDAHEEASSSGATTDKTVMLKGLTFSTCAIS